MTQATRLTGPNPAAPLVAKAPAAADTTAAPAPASAATFGADSFSRGRRQDRYDLEIDLVGCRIYVLDKKTHEPVASYLTSPGRKSYPTQGDHFTIHNALTKAPWNPPQSAWAKGAKQVPGGMNNPMGIFKMSLGAYAQYIHGTPASERKDLGKPASHGCLRMSNENVLQLYQRYVGVGTEVKMNRDPKRSAELKTALAAKGLKDHAITDGAELVADAAKGKAPKPVE